MPSLFKIFLHVGLFFLLIALFLWVTPEMPFLNNLGNLPGDLILKNDGNYLYLPIVSSLLISLLLTFIHYLFSGLKKSGNE